MLAEVTRTDVVFRVEVLMFQGWWRGRSFGVGWTGLATAMVGCPLALLQAHGIPEAFVVSAAAIAIGSIDSSSDVSRRHHIFNARSLYMDLLQVRMKLGIEPAHPHADIVESHYAEMAEADHFGLRQLLSMLVRAEGVIGFLWYLSFR